MNVVFAFGHLCEFLLQSTGCYTVLNYMNPYLRCCATEVLSILLVSILRVLLLPSSPTRTRGQVQQLHRYCNIAAYRIIDSCKTIGMI